MGREKYIRSLWYVPSALIMLLSITRFHMFPETWNRLSNLFLEGVSQKRFISVPGPYRISGGINTTRQHGKFETIPELYKQITVVICVRSFLGCSFHILPLCIHMAPFNNMVLVILGSRSCLFDFYLDLLKFVRGPKASWPTKALTDIT